MSDATPRARRSLPTRELRAQLADVLRRAADGEPTVVTTRGRPVAQVGPVGSTLRADLPALAAAGLATPPVALRRPAAPAPIELPVDVRLDRLIDEVRP